MIKYKNIHLKFDNKLILKDFNLSIPPGGKVLITGKSGIGKTTLLRLVLGFVQPQKGEIFFNNSSLTMKTIREIRGQTAYVAQGLELGAGNVQEILEKLFTFKKNQHLKFDIKKTTEILTFLELEAAILQEQYESLSGGEKQRIAILATQLLQRKIFLLDEATSALDEDLKVKVVELFMSRPESTVLAVSHDPAWRQHKNVKIIDLGRF